MTSRPPWRTRLRLGAALGAALAACAVGAHAPAASAAPSSGATGLHEGMMPADSPDAAPSGTTGTLGGSSVTATSQPTGIDVSSHQHGTGASINWSQVKAGGQSFAIVKATEYYTDTDTGQKVLYTNPWYSQDVAGARAAGLVVGSYVFAHPENPPAAQADQYSAFIGTVPDGSLPPVLDLEVNGGLSPAQLVTWTQTFLDRLQQDTGIVPMIYTSPGFWNSSLGGSTAFSGYPLWEAHYTTAASPAVFGGWTTYDIWQWTSSGTVPGVTPGPVDQNRFNGTSPASLAERVRPTSLSAPATLEGGDSLTSPEQQYRLVMQTDGNLVEYGNGRALWSTRTAGNPGATLDVQDDGNVVLYSADRTALWSSYTYWAQAAARLTVQDDGNVVIYAGGKAVWADGSPGSDTLTAGAELMPGQYLHNPYSTAKVVMQGDGNLVVYRSGVARWSSRTNGWTGAYAVLQTDGNLVVYDSGGVARWASWTAGSGANRLVMQGDGNLVLYAGSRAVWATWTN